MDKDWRTRPPVTDKPPRTAADVAAFESRLRWMLAHGMADAVKRLDPQFYAREGAWRIPDADA